MIECPWIITYEANEILSLLAQINFQIRHICREINQGANFLANFGCKEYKCFNFDNFESLPRMLKGIVNLDRCGMSSIRCKKL